MKNGYVVRLGFGIIVLVFCAGLTASRTLAADGVESAGDVLQFAIPAAAYGATYYFDDYEGRVQFYKSFLTGLLVTEGLKHTITKSRPNGGEHSFPSEHASAAFQGAAFIQQRYGLKFGLPAYLGAAFVGYSRVESDQHYTEDVLAGACIGALSSIYFTTPYREYSITPIAGRSGYGIKIGGRW